MSVLFLRNQGKCQFSLAAELAADFKFGRAEIQRTLLVVEFGCNLAYISRFNRVLEADLVNSGIEGEVPRDVVLDHYGTALGHNLALDYSWNNRVAREMSAGEELIFLDGVFAMSYTILIYLGLINKKHRLSVRQKIFNVFLVHLILGLVRLWYSSGTGGVPLFYSSVYFLNATQASCPPKPRESEIPNVRSAFTALLGV